MGLGFGLASVRLVASMRLGFGLGLASMGLGFGLGAVRLGLGLASVRLGFGLASRLGSRVTQGTEGYEQRR